MFFRFCCCSLECFHGPLRMSFLEGPFSTMAACPKTARAPMGRFPSLMGRFPTLTSRFPKYLNGPFSLLKIPWKTAHEEKANEKGQLKGEHLRIKFGNAVHFARQVNFQCSLQDKAIRKVTSRQHEAKEIIMPVIPQTETQVNFWCKG